MRISLRKKTILTIIVITVLISLVSILFCRKAVTDVMRRQNELKCMDLGNTVASLIDREKVERVRDSILEIYYSTDKKVSNEDWGSPEHEEYIHRFDAITQMKEYQDLQQWIRKIQDQNDIAWMYLLYPDMENRRILYLIDGAYEDTCSPGSYDYLTKSDVESLKTPEKGLKTEITNTEEYGWLIAAARPILDDEGRLVAYVGVDVSMNELMKSRDSYMSIMIAAQFIILAVLCISAIYLVNHFIIHPVNILSEASLDYCGEKVGEIHHSFSKLNIKTGDEIEDLANSMVRMENDINEHIASLTETTRELIAARQKEMELDRAANIDPLTRIGNKRAYDRDAGRLTWAIERGEAVFGIVMMDLNDLKILNDKYGHDHGDIGIKNLSSLACRIFKNSSVFRLGGDEFVAILREEDLSQVDELLAEFSRTIEERKADPNLMPWDKVEAAIGFALYDSSIDETVEDVLKRADHAMYIHKKKMKESEVR